ncbi:adenosylcobinamide-GDP ribazoletransferase [Gracilinema caldarium]|uniref:adenosylcobinamide-GDP ribazoletransferase n=1 Tax=Gracilinema caldarium TaxID=215591 RepID=UPI0026F27A69|nr:adenosylcobinamide-GDP ribazoletransferase [Gracilinema caldarium]
MKKKNIDVQPDAESPPSAVDRFLSSLSLVCRVPLPFSFTFSAARLDFYLPITALFQSMLFSLGFAAGAWFFRDLALAALTALMLQYGAFNLFHFDGLLDTADAFLGAFDREKRFQILKDPRIGVYGIFTALSYLSFKFLILVSMMSFLFPAFAGRASHSILLSPPLFLLLLFPLAGKTAGSLIPAIYEPAKQEGLGALAAGSRLRSTMLGFLAALALYLAVPLLLFIFASPESPIRMNLFIPKDAFWQSSGFFRWELITFLQLFLFAACLAFLSSLTSGLAIGGLYKKGLGGYTGDSLGAAIELGELLYLLALFVWIQHS